LSGAGRENRGCDRSVGPEFQRSYGRAFGGESVIGVVDLDARGRTAKEVDAVALVVKGSVKVPREHGSHLAVAGEHVPELGPVGELAGRIVMRSALCTSLSTPVYRRVSGAGSSTTAPGPTVSRPPPCPDFTEAPTLKT
jgi:hypothetical protein